MEPSPQYSRLMRTGGKINGNALEATRCGKPIGMATPVPVVLSDKLRSLPDGQLWLGGGEVDLKLRVDVAQFCEKLMPGGRPVEFADVLE